MIDLHIHSTFSDGKLNVDEIISEAKIKNISIISITDHDNIESVKALYNYNEVSRLRFIPGVELSAVSYYFGNKMKVHILGYGYNYLDSNLNKSLERLHNQRDDDNEKYVKQVIQEFPFMSLDMFRDFDYGKYGWISKSILNQIASTDKVNDLENLKKYLMSIKPIYHNYNFSIEEAIEIILKSGGYPIIAHPFKLDLNNDKFDDFIKYLISCGLVGVETYHNDANIEQIMLFHNLASKYQLYESGGSDFHSYVYDKGLGAKSAELTENLPFVKKLILDNKANGGK